MEWSFVSLCTAYSEIGQVTKRIMRKESVFRFYLAVECILKKKRAFFSEFALMGSGGGKAANSDFREG